MWPRAPTTPSRSPAPFWRRLGGAGRLCAGGRHQTDRFGGRQTGAIHVRDLSARRLVGGGDVSPGDIPAMFALIWKHGAPEFLVENRPSPPERSSGAALGYAMQRGIEQRLVLF